MSMYIYTHAAAKCDVFGSVGGTLPSQSVRVLPPMVLNE